MPRAPRFWGPRAYSLLFFPEFFIPWWLFQCEAPKSQSPPENARPQTLFCTLFQCSSAGTKEPKVLRKRQAPELKNSRPQRAGPQTVFLFPVSGRDPNSAGPQRVHGPQKRNPKIKIKRQAPTFKKQRLQKQGRKQKILYLLWGRRSKKLGQKNHRVQKISKFAVNCKILKDC